MVSSLAQEAQERAANGRLYSGTWLTTTHRIKKELSICQSLLCLDLVSFPVLSQITIQYQPRPTHFLVGLKWLLSPLQCKCFSERHPFGWV